MIAQKKSKPGDTDVPTFIIFHLRCLNSSLVNIVVLEIFGLYWYSDHVLHTVNLVYVFYKHCLV